MKLIKGMISLAILALSSSLMADDLFSQLGDVEDYVMKHNLCIDKVKVAGPTSSSGARATYNLCMADHYYIDAMPFVYKLSRMQN